MANVKVPDWSGWNTVNYAKAKKDNVDNVILKAVNSKNNKDKMFETHLKGCTDAGIDLLATYHYSYATTTAKAKDNANYWIDAVNGRCNKFYLDWEDASLPKNHSAIDIINTYGNIMKANKMDMGIYCGLYWYNAYLKKYASELPYDFWIARYPSTVIMANEQDPNTNYKPSVTDRLDGWQYTSKGQIDGVSGNSDISVWYENMKQKVETVIVPVDYNPFVEPTVTIKLGMTGDGVKWVQWYLYRFGMLLGADGLPDADAIDGVFGNQTYIALRQAQRVLGLVEDGLCGKITRATFKKIC